MAVCDLNVVIFASHLAGQEPLIFAGQPACLIDRLGHARGWFHLWVTLHLGLRLVFRVRLSSDEVLRHVSCLETWFLMSRSWLCLSILATPVTCLKPAMSWLMSRVSMSRHVSCFVTAS